MAKQKDYQQEARRKVEEKLSDRFWRLNNLYYIMTDKGEKVKFSVNRVQYLLYTAMWWLNLVLKSRQHGITTFICIFFLDACLFNSNVRAGIIAHRMDDAKKIFRDKIKYAYDNLEFMQQAVKIVKDDASEILFDNNSGIAVGMSMRSGTLQYLHISEYGWICAHYPQRAKEIKSGALETVHEGGMIFIESTAEGMGNDFHAMCDAAQAKKGTELSKMDFKFHFFPWYDKPENTTDPAAIAISPELAAYFAKVEMKTGIVFSAGQRAWYAKKKETLGLDIYKEHPSTPDESFMASLDGSYYGAQLVRAREEGRIGVVPHDPMLPVIAAWDLGDMHTSIWFIQISESKDIRFIDYYEDNSGIGIPGYANVIHVKPYAYQCHFTGSDILSSNRKKNGRVMIDEAAVHKIHFTPIEDVGVSQGIVAFRDIVLPMARFDEKRCKDGLKRLAGYHKDKNELVSTEDTPVFHNTPCHDENSHGADAGRHFAVGYLYSPVDGRLLRSGREVTYRERIAEVDLLSV